VNFIGRYEILDEEELKSNVLYSAKDVENNKKVLIKLIEHNKNIRPEFISNLIDESTVIKGLKSPYIQPILDVGTYLYNDKKFYYIVSEYSAGITLDKIIDGNYIHIEALVNMATQIVKALDMAHSHNLYHGDLKPKNILVDKWYNVLICDFGVTQANGGVNLRLDKDISYLSPHQLNINYTDKETDFYDLGLILYEAIFKKLPYGVGQNEKEMLSLIDKGINWREVYAANDNQELINLIKKLLSRVKKYENAQEILLDISKILYKKADIEEIEEEEGEIEEKDEYKNKIINKKILLVIFIICMISIIILSSIFL
jgi:serine/threonine protein kinase